MAVQVVKDTAGNVLWTTDKAQINSESNNVTYQVQAVQLTYSQANGTPANASMGAGAVGNLYANAVFLPGNTVSTYYVGAGNYLNILTGAGGFTAMAVGTATSATAGSNGP
jgi:hypothetical protein